MHNPYPRIWKHFCSPLPNKYLNGVKGTGMHTFIPAVGWICTLNTIFPVFNRKGSWRKMCQKKPPNNLVRQWLVTKSWFPAQVSYFPWGPPLATCVCAHVPSPDATSQEAAGWVNALTNKSCSPSFPPLLLPASRCRPATKSLSSNTPYCFLHPQLQNDV